MKCSKRSVAPVLRGKEAHPTVPQNQPVQVCFDPIVWCFVCITFSSETGAPCMHFMFGVLTSTHTHHVSFLLPDYVNASKTDDQFRNYNDSATQERVLNFYKSQHQHQTFSWVIEQENKYSNHNKLKLTVWEVFTLMDTFIDDSDPDTEQSQTIHALQSAEAARKQYPGGSYDWLHLTCFIHDLGKLLGAPVEGFNLPGKYEVGVYGCAGEKLIHFGIIYPMHVCVCVCVCAFVPKKTKAVCK